MNRRYQPKNRAFQNSSYFQRYNFSSFKPITRRPRFNNRFIQKTRRNRLQRAQNAYNFSNNFQHPYQQNSSNKNNNSNTNNNENVNYNREIYVKGLPRYVDDQGLFTLFKNEGRIINSNILYDNVGFSRGIGRILFANFKDAMNAIKKWNNTDYKGNTLKVEYKTTKNGENSHITYNNYQKSNRNNNYSRPFNFIQRNNYGNNFRSNYYYNNNYNNNGYNRFRSYRNNN